MRWPESVPVLDKGRFRLIADFRKKVDPTARVQFASDLDATTRAQLERGERLTELLKQAQYSPLAVEEQVVVIYAGTRGYLDTVPTAQVGRFESELLSNLHSKHQGILDTIRTQKELKADTEASLKDALEAFVKTFA